MSAIALDNTLGAALIGLVFASTLNGVTIVQAWYYFTHETDGWPLKLLVCIVIGLDTLHEALITHTVYTYNITNWGDVAALQSVVWSNSVEAIVNGFIAILVQCYLISRVWRFSKHNRLLTGAILLMALAQFVTNTTATALSFKVNTYAEVERLSNLLVAISALTVATDALITAALCVLLHRSRTGFSRSDTMITKLMVFSLNTGLLTSVCALGSMIFILSAKHTFIYMAFYFNLGRLYTNCLLATLNSRKSIRTADSTMRSEDISLSRGTFSKGIAVESRRQTGISIKIDTTQEFGSDKRDYSGDLEAR